MTATPLSDEAEAACRRLVIAFAHHLDHREFAQVADLFAADGVWERHGEQLVGPYEVAALLARRPPTVRERHVMTTIHITAVSPVECAGTSYAMIFRTEAEPDAPPPVVPGPSSLAEFHDRFQLTAYGWRLAHRRSELVFTCR
ncbi:nuclear transport factor 2 family protein [Nocardia sp. NBC_00508]|uniref:nuclear transport factor 2 family protein n=1 Tax=Nocardia sp. NBC_00508 TaxID=2975992 RepID=UPI002E80713C|nr:nuclear transport factor 2 family protein [Nocardia sp. NBC_00508]WUD64775.1 nuclear transport factor 2 family protein [Nocardia sp. NBC_00508]